MTRIKIVLKETAETNSSQPQQRYSLPDQVAKAFTNTAYQQRGEAEDAMNHAQDVLGGCGLSYCLEHVGDIIFVMTQKTNLASVLGGPQEGRYLCREGDVLIKAQKTFDKIKEPTFFSDSLESIERNRQYRKETSRHFFSQQDVKMALQKYSEAHSKIPVYNHPQYMARTAAVSLGKMDRLNCVASLRAILSLIKSGDFVREALSYQLDSSGQPLQYSPPY